MYGPEGGVGEWHVTAGGVIRISIFEDTGRAGVIFLANLPRFVTRVEVVTKRRPREQVVSGTIRVAMLAVVLSIVPPWLQTPQ